MWAMNLQVSMLHSYKLLQLIPCRLDTKKQTVWNVQVSWDLQPLESCNHLRVDIGQLDQQPVSQDTCQNNDHRVKSLRIGKEMQTTGYSSGNIIEVGGWIVGRWLLELF